MFWGEKSDLGVKSGFVVGKMPSFLDESEIWVEKVSSMEEKRGPEGKKRSYFWEKSGVFERRDRSFDIVLFPYLSVLPLTPFGFPFYMASRDFLNFSVYFPPVQSEIASFASLTLRS